MHRIPRIDALQRAGVSQVVVNKHYLADQIDGWAAARATPHIVVQDEEALILDTGGGVAKALPHLGPDPFFVLNSDSFWVDGPAPALQRMRDAWNDATMDCLLLLARKNHSTGFDGPGDFDMDDTGRLARRSGETAEHVYAGAYLVHPRLFRDAPEGAFSMNELWNRALAEGRLHGLVHDGWWLHVGTPDAIALAEDKLRQLGQP